MGKQLSVVSRGQLLALGVTGNVMQYRIRAGGPWQVLLPGIYLGTSGAPSLAQKEMAALLYAGPGSLITGPTALMHHSIRSGADLNVIDVLVPAERQRHSTGFARLYRTARMPSRTASIGPVCLTLVPVPWPIPHGSSPASGTSAPSSRRRSSSADAPSASWPPSSAPGRSGAPLCSVRF